MDGQEAYDEIVKKGGPDAFDVILMDLHMPRKVRSCLHGHQDCCCAPRQKFLNSTVLQDFSSGTPGTLQKQVLNLSQQAHSSFCMGLQVFQHVSSFLLKCTCRVLPCLQGKVLIVLWVV